MHVEFCGGFGKNPSENINPDALSPYAESDFLCQYTQLPINTTSGFPAGWTSDDISLSTGRMLSVSFRSGSKVNIIITTTHGDSVSMKVLEVVSVSLPACIGTEPTDACVSCQYDNGILRVPPDEYIVPPSMGSLYSGHYLALKAAERSSSSNARYSSSNSAERYLMRQGRRVYIKAGAKLVLLGLNGRNAKTSHLRAHTHPNTHTLISL